MKEILASRGERAGLVCIFATMEPCSTYKPWHNKQTGKTYRKALDFPMFQHSWYSAEKALRSAGRWIFIGY